jgi:outer membrane lipoprotein-sorting protein
MVKKSNTLLIFLGLTTILATSLLSFADPMAENLLKASLGPGHQAYQGHMTVTHWSDRGTRSEEFEILFVPPNRYRLEFYRPDGRVGRVVWSNGDQERVEFPNGKKVYLGKAVKSSSKLMEPDNEWQLLLTNYLITQTGSEPVAGRQTWILQLVPKSKGKPNQMLWIDKEKDMILKVKRFQPKTNFAVLSQFTQIEMNPKFDPASFDLQPSTTRVKTQHGLDPDFLSIEDLKENTDMSAEPPSSLQQGFVFESGDFFTVRGKVVRHFRYTDGLTVLSLFETKKPVQFREKPLASVAPDAPGPGVFHTTGPTHVVHWKSGGRHYTLMGDLSQQALQEISTSIK